MYRNIDVTATDIKEFELAMELCFDNYVAKSYKVDKNKLILYWTATVGSDIKTQPFLYEHNLERSRDFVWGWLESTTPLGKQPDTDGSVGTGFRICSRVEDEWYVICSIEPVWIIYGK